MIEMFVSYCLLRHVVFLHTAHLQHFVAELSHTATRQLGGQRATRANGRVGTITRQGGGHTLASPAPVYSSVESEGVRWVQIRSVNPQGNAGALGALARLFSVGRSSACHRISGQVVFGRRASQVVVPSL